MGSHVSVRIVNDFHRAIWGRRSEIASLICGDEKRVEKLFVPKSIPTLKEIRMMSTKRTTKERTQVQRNPSRGLGHR